MVMVRVRVIFRAVFFCVVFFTYFYFPHCIFPRYIYSLNNKLTLTMKNIDVTQETTAKLRSNKRELETKLQHKSNKNQIGFEPECT